MNGHHSRRAAAIACITFLGLCPIAARAQSTTDAAATESDPLLDTALPPIWSIGAGSDVRAFLAADVPAELKRAALRRAWATDPTVRDFVGLSENSWEFSSHYPDWLAAAPQSSQSDARQ
jgi:hypothetical protein